jgi:hypothetical protein
MQASWDDSLKELLKAQSIDGFALYDAFQRDRLLSAFGDLKDGIFNDNRDYFNQIDAIFQGRDVPSSVFISLDNHRLIVTLCTTDKIYAISRGKKLGLLIYNLTNQGMLIISFSQPYFLQYVVPIVEKALFGFPPRLVQSHIINDFLID